MNNATRPQPGTRPAQPVICAERPDDWLCCWSCREPQDRPRYWELKFIHRGCHLHNKLQSV